MDQGRLCQRRLLASGRKVPRTGGFILAQGDRVETEALVATDPFTISGVTIYDIIEVAVAFTAPGLEQLKVNARPNAAFRRAS